MLSPSLQYSTSAVSSSEWPTELPADAFPPDTWFRQLRRAYWGWRFDRTDVSRRKRVEGDDYAFYHGRCSDNSTCVLSFAPAPSLAWYLAGLHNWLHFRRLHLGETRALYGCRVLDWLAGSTCLVRLDRYN